MELIKLVGVLIVIVGFALKLDSILIIFLALVATGLAGGLTPGEFLESVGSNFVANRSMAIFVMTYVVVGTLERNGLKNAAADLMRKIKGATVGRLVSAFGILNAIFGAFYTSFGGVAGFIRPVFMPMAEGAIESQGKEPKEEHLEEVKGEVTGMFNITWFFFQMLFVGSSGGILVQGTLSSLGYEVSLLDLVIVEVPIAIIALIVACIYYLIQDKKLMKKYYGDDKK
jgi:uncharacterized membrane protein